MNKNEAIKIEQNKENKLKKIKELSNERIPLSDRKEYI